MYRSILVPLDRSSFAEQALPLAFGIARRGNVPLDLVEVHALYALEDPLAGRLHFDKNEDAEWKQQEQVYLDATAKWAAVASQLRITTAVLSGSVVLPESVAASILERALRGQCRPDRDDHPRPRSLGPLCASAASLTNSSVMLGYRSC